MNSQSMVAPSSKMLALNSRSKVATYKYVCMCRRIKGCLDASNRVCVCVCVLCAVNHPHNP